MSKGVLLFANNNGSIDYIKQAIFLAKRINKYLQLPVSLVTCNKLKKDQASVFDKVIPSALSVKTSTTKRHHDGDMYDKITKFYNNDRAYAYDLSPYDETIVMDTDYIICNNLLNKCFEQDNAFLIYKDATHVGIHDGTTEFKRVSDTSVDFYWATVFYFKKCEETQIFFDLIKHIQENYLHYRSMYQFRTTVYRNDFAFSIAVHILSGYSKNNFVGVIPGKKFYTIDRDILLSIKDDEFKILVEKQDRLGEYTPVNFKGSNLHVMNKFSLERIINEQ